MSQSKTKPTATPDHYRLTLDGEDHNVPIAEGETLLQAALAAGIDAPHSCTEGRCGTCMSWLRSGDVLMPPARALSQRNIEKGYVLACQSRPSSSESIWLDFDL
jgi:ring-1,2-phenylacetyl-CoA epoxidase subunit PaaE